MSIDSLEKSMKEVDPASRDRFQELLTKLDTQVSRHVAGLVDDSRTATKNKKMGTDSAARSARPAAAGDVEAKHRTKRATVSANGTSSSFLSRAGRAERAIKQLDAKQAKDESSQPPVKPWLEKIKQHSPAILTLGLSAACMAAVLVWSFSSATAWSDPARRAGVFDAVTGATQTSVANKKKPEADHISDAVSVPVSRPVTKLSAATDSSASTTFVRSDAGTQFEPAVKGKPQAAVASTLPQSMPIATATSAPPNAAAPTSNTSGSNCSGAALALNLCASTTR
jgi:hypothetical protein